MKKESPNSLELYSREVFQVLLEYEINRSRRYPTSLTLLSIALKVDPNNTESLMAADKITADILNANLRGADIPSKTGNEYLILLPTTDDNGGRVVCERLLGLMKRAHQTPSGKLFNITAHIGMTTMEGPSVSAPILISQAARALSAARAQTVSTYSIFAEPASNKGAE